MKIGEPKDVFSNLKYDADQYIPIPFRIDCVEYTYMISEPDRLTYHVKGLEPYAHMEIDLSEEQIDDLVGLSRIARDEINEVEEIKIKIMEEAAKGIVKDYIIEHLDKSDAQTSFEIYTVWKCKILKNWKFLISSSLYDGMYYEVTFNGEKREWYLDAYKKFENKCIPVGDSRFWR